ncbi:MFS transporter [Microbaculum marinum]|uniref:MFS transporter n=1 Tax=Microbaculum marinum TaxID=1764581 RepID=A0AAW9RM50_9HYPH
MASAQWSLPMPSLRLLPAPLLAVNLSAFFSLGLLQMVAMATPMWGSHLGLSAALIGLAAGCRSISPFVYAIHIGSLLDIVGVRRLLIFFSLQCAVLPLLYPLLPANGPFLILQVFLGLASATAWIASQTAIARTAGGDARKTGWFSFFASAGTVIGPLALGLIWSWLGPNSGYYLMAAWGGAMFAVSLTIPARKDIVRPKLRFGHFIPRFRIYALAIASLKRPVMAFVMACTFIRLGGVGMVESFFPVLVQERGLSAATVGILFAIGNFAGSPSSLLANRWVLICGSARMALILSVAVSTACLVAVPFLSQVWLLTVAMAGYGFGVGISMPVIFALLSQDVAPEQQGMTAGIRTTANRLAAFVVPVAVGLLAEFAGVSTAFWMAGLVLLVALFGIAATVGRRI